MGFLVAFVVACFFDDVLRVFAFLAATGFLTVGVLAFLGLAAFLAFLGDLAFWGLAAFFALVCLATLGFSPRWKLPEAPVPANTTSEYSYTMPMMLNV